MPGEDIFVIWRIPLGFGIEAEPQMSVKVTEYDVFCYCCNIIEKKFNMGIMKLP